MSDHADTIRRAFAEYDDDTEMVLHKADAALDALLAERQQLAQERDLLRAARVAATQEMRELKDQRRQAIDALRIIAQPNWEAKVTAQDARDMVAFANAALEKLGEDRP